MAKLADTQRWELISRILRLNAPWSYILIRHHATACQLTNRENFLCNEAPGQRRCFVFGMGVAVVFDGGVRAICTGILGTDGRLVQAVYVRHEMGNLDNNSQHVIRGGTRRHRRLKRRW
jgi:hypothetical protein